MQAFWFGIIAVLWAGFFVLEGFDFGVGMLLPVVGRTDEQRRIALRTIGPVWDGNEVWLLTAGGATFAAFPAWYAGVFSGFYLPLALILVGLIVRGIGIEYRGKAQTDSGRRWCDLGTTVGSLLPALLFGVAFANIMRGVQMDSQHNMRNTFWSLLNPYSLLGGVVTLSLFLFHGAVYLALRTEDGPVRDAARALIPRLAPVTAVAAVAFLGWTATIRGGWVSIVLAVLIALTFVASAFYGLKGRDGLSFTLSAVTTLLVPVWVFAVLWPNVLPARNNAAFSLTVHNASSSPYTLKVMTVVALVMTPVVLAYQAWAFWVFRARVSGADVAVDAYSGGGGVTKRIEGTLHKAMHSAHETLGTGPDAGTSQDSADSASQRPEPAGTSSTS